MNVGWQWGKEYAICTTDWTKTAGEPPAGHLNIANEEVYSVLNDIYAYLIESFQSPDIFHLGGDEVTTVPSLSFKYIVNLHGYVNR